MNTNSAVRIYKTRDSATSMLRKMGVQAKDYNSFIKVLTDGTYACHVAKAEMYLISRNKTAAIAEVGNPAPEATSAKAKEAARIAKNKAGRAVQAEEPKNKRGGVATMARELILAGKTNKEIWDALKQAFDLDDSKRHYPAWYRSEMRRKGLVRE